MEEKDDETRQLLEDCLRSLRVLSAAGQRRRLTILGAKADECLLCLRDLEECYGPADDWPIKTEVITPLRTQLEPILKAMEKLLGHLPFSCQTLLTQLADELEKKKHNEHWDEVASGVYKRPVAVIRLCHDVPARSRSLATKVRDVVGLYIRQ